VSGSGISLAVCKYAPCSRQITTPAPHRSVFYRPDALPVAQPTARCQILRPKCTKFDLRWCSAPNPRWESLQRSPDPLVVFKEPTSKGKAEKRDGEGEGKGREREEEGK